MSELFFHDSWFRAISQRSNFRVNIESPHFSYLCAHHSTYIIFKYIYADNSKTYIHNKVSNIKYAHVKMQ